MDFLKSKRFLLSVLMLNASRCDKDPDSFDQEVEAPKGEEDSEADKSKFCDIAAKTILSSRAAGTLDRYARHNQVPSWCRALLGEKAGGPYAELAAKDHEKFGVGLHMSLSPLLYGLVAWLRGEEIAPEVQKNLASFATELNKFTIRQVKDVIMPLVMAVKACEAYEEHAERVEMIYRAMEAKAVAEGKQFGSQMIEVEGDKKDTKARHELEFKKAGIIQESMGSTYPVTAMEAIKKCSIRPLEEQVQPNLNVIPISALAAKAEVGLTEKRTTIIPAMDIQIGYKSGQKKGSEIKGTTDGGFLDCAKDVWRRIKEEGPRFGFTWRISASGAIDNFVGYSHSDNARAQLADAKALSLMQRKTYAAECETQRTRFKDLEGQEKQLLRIFDDALLSWSTGASQGREEEYPLSHVLDIARKVLKVSMEKTKAAADYQKALFEMRAEEGALLPDWAKTKIKTSKVSPKKGKSGSLVIHH